MDIKHIPFVFILTLLSFIISGCGHEERTIYAEPIHKEINLDEIEYPQNRTESADSTISDSEVLTFVVQAQWQKARYYRLRLLAIATAVLSILLIISSGIILLLKIRHRNSIYIMTIESLRLNLKDIANKYDYINSENQTLRESLKENESKISSIDTDLSKSRSAIKSAMNYKASLLDKCCEIYYAHPSSTDLSNKFFKTVKNEIEGIKKDKQIRRNLEDTANDIYNDIMVKFRDEFKDTLNPWEFDLYLYIIMGFSPLSISIFQEIKPSAVYNRKSKLKKKIENSSTKSKEVFLSLL